MPSPELVSTEVYASGITVLWSEAADTEHFCRELASVCNGIQASLALVWFSPTRHNAAKLSETIHAQLPELEFCGCSTSGEITPDGMQDHGIVAILLPTQWFSTSVCLIENIIDLGMETIAQRASETRIAFQDRVGEQSNRIFAMNLIDGLTYSEEMVTVALDRGLDGIRLIGGSAGDDLHFTETQQITNGKSYSGASILILIHCGLPHRLFTNNNFVPTDHKLVVTQADPEHRTVYEFNAEPAAVAYANAIGVDLDALDASSFASHSVVVRVGGEYFCRSIQQLNSDQSLTFFCAIDNGLVLTVARSIGMVASSREAIDTIESEIGPIDMMFGFDCIYRKLDAQHRQTTHRIAKLYQDTRFVGFNTYGEQYSSMHINQTLTGIAIGSPLPSSTDDTETEIGTESETESETEPRTESGTESRTGIGTESGTGI